MDDLSAEFKAWVMARDPNNRFDYISNTDCAYAQFLKQTGRSSEPNVSSGHWYNGKDYTPNSIPKSICDWLLELIRTCDPVGAYCYSMAQLQQIVST